MSKRLHRMAYVAAVILALVLAHGASRQLATAQQDDDAGDDAGDATDDAPTPKPRFSHESHKELGVNVNKCSQCHTLDASYNVLAATQKNPHAPCNEECHMEEFFAKEPTICGVCHETVEPWEKLETVVRKRRKTEFGKSKFSHKSHLKAVRKKGGGDGCQKCHGDVFSDDNSGGKKVSGHAGCGSCHGKAVKPRMTKCGSCHKLGEIDAATAAKQSEWAVGAKFTHTTHSRDPRNQKDTKCSTCHRGVVKATTLQAIKNPTMKSCDACHDGKHAFKTTGFGCLKCHGGADE